MTRETPVRPAVRLIAYGPDAFEEKGEVSLDSLKDRLGRHAVVWLNVEGLSDIDLVRRLGAIFGLHELAIEDVVTPQQRSKVEEFGDHLYVVMRIPALLERLETEQVSLFLGKGFVLTFQEGRPGDCFDPVRTRLRSGKSLLNSSGPDRLAYSLIDEVVESYFPILEACGDRLQKLETRITSHPAPNQISQLHAVKQDLLNLRRALWPLREALNWLLRESSAQVTPETRVYLRDCHDHTLRLLDRVDTYRELASDLSGVYLSCVGNRTNEVMKFLTIISTIFIPLSFIAGVYGMNFKTESSPWSMPELAWYWGYPFVLALMAAVAAGLVGMFWRWGWLGARRGTGIEP